MLDFFNNKPDDAIVILKKDHDTVKNLFDRFEDSNSIREKKKLVAEALMELKIHATIEEEIFYPALRAHKVEKDILNEADEEHHVAKLLVAELDQMNGTEDHFEAKFIVLAENIRHHIKEEEGDMFPQARKTGLDFSAIGKKMLARKQELKKQGVPVSAEEKMISSFKGDDDSPAINSRKKAEPAAMKAKGSEKIAKLVSKKGKAAPAKKARANHS